MRWPRLSTDLGLEPLTPRTLTSLEALQAELARVRHQGYALDDEECEVGVRCVAVPVRDFTGRVVASVSVTGPATRMTDAKIAAGPLTARRGSEGDFAPPRIRRRRIARRGLMAPDARFDKAPPRR